MKDVLGVIKDKILYPFNKDLIYFLLLWVFISLPNCYSQKNNITYVIYLLMMYYIVTYIVVVLINLYKRISKILKPIVLVIITLVSLLNLYCFINYGCLLSFDYVQIITGTNPDEAKEFFSIYVSGVELILFVLVIAISIFIAFKLPRLQQIKLGVTWIVASFFLLLSIGAIYHNSGILKEEFKDKVLWNFRFDEVVDLRCHLTHPKIEECDSIHPKHIVIILGESFSANHSSLYGYEKCTNPLLAKQEEVGNLLVIKNVTSPCTHTIASFRYLLNTYSIKCKDGKPWYEHANIIETMKVAGYHTVWISNQAEKGMFENIPGSHARLCDETFFLENEKGDDRFDGRLLGYRLSKHHEYNCIFYHLMGQHGSFKERYPKAYEVFNGKDYNAYPPHQRDILASYDNATLYNDYVVNSIMELYKDQDAVVFYFPDHALDLFDTDPDYFGHAKKTKASQIQGKKIPFVVYVSPIFRKFHSKKYERMRKKSVKSFCTDAFIYTVMDVTGFRFADSRDRE
ncbi:MAG: sulfatase-like hydrolase/transferase [Prevotella sp.]|nr:sulfatase-like hydrolase/transferase [Prevotella sp.]